MKKLLFYTLIISGGIAVAWHYLPQDSRDKTTAFIGSILGGDAKQEVEKFIGDKVLPKDPEKRRSVLLDELKNELAELETIKAKTGQTNVTDNTRTFELLKQSDNIIKQLGEANKDTSLTNKVAEKILGTFVSTKSDPGACETKK